MVVGTTLPEKRCVCGGGVGGEIEREREREREREYDFTSPAGMTDTERQT
jgi:hypothetical protein